MSKEKVFQHRFELRVDDWTNRRLSELASKSKDSKSEVVRSLLRDALIREMPPADYFTMMKELHYIGHNLNQIATMANFTGNIDFTEYQRQAALLREAVLRIQQAVELPKRKE